jgi:hypothetical protein
MSWSGIKFSSQNAMIRSAIARHARVSVLILCVGWSEVSRICVPFHCTFDGPSHNRVMLLINIAFDPALECRISTPFVITLYRFPWLAKGEGERQQCQPPPRSVISFVDDGDVVGGGEQAVARWKGHVLLVDMPGGDHAHVLDLLQCCDIERSIFRQLLSDQQSLAAKRGAFLGVLGAFRRLKQLGTCHRCVIAQRDYGPSVVSADFPFSPPPWRVTIMPSGVGCPVIACPIRTWNHWRSDSGSACNAFSQSGWVNPGR